MGLGGGWTNTANSLGGGEEALGGMGCGCGCGLAAWAGQVFVGALWAGPEILGWMQLAARAGL